MSFPRCSSVISLAALSFVLACSSGSGQPTSLGGADTPKGHAGGSSGGGAPVSGAGSTGTSGAAGTSGATGAGAAGSDNSGAGAPSTGGGGSAGSAGALASAGAGGAPTDQDPSPPRAINVVPGPNFSANFNGQPMFVNKSKPAMGKLVLLLGGICTGTGAGGFESFIKQYGFHVFAPKTQTCVTSAPDKYLQTIKTMPMDTEANRQVGDARTELWDGKDRVDWVTVNKGESILEETIAAIQNGIVADPGGDWGYFLNSDGTLRTTDVWVVGYSWGSQSWAMISAYVRFGRVILTSGPVSEGFPNAEWILHPAASGTPGNRKYMLADLPSPYPVPGAGNMEKFDNVMRAGWTGMVTSVTPDGMGTYTADQHIFAMIGSNAQSPGGHTVFCNDNPMNGWLPLCKHLIDTN